LELRRKSNTQCLICKDDPTLGNPKNRASTEDTSRCRYHRAAPSGENHLNPAGKLTFSWPKELHDSPTYAIGTADKDDVNYKEGVFVGYRYFDTRKLTPQVPFGFGLSYSAFALSDLTITQTLRGFHVTVNVKNLSSRSGSQVVQLYLAPLKLFVPRPVHELRGFQRLTLQPGEMGQVSFDLEATSFRHWDTEAHAWTDDPGDYAVQIGDSSRNLHAHINVPSSISKEKMSATGACTGSTERAYQEKTTL
jgi:hypothetical protein